MSREGKARLSRVLTVGPNSAERRMLLALLWCGPTTPLATLAVRAGLCAPDAKTDSARKKGRRVFERLVARELVVQTHIRECFAACTHVSIPGREGRLECQRLRAARGLGETCSAHHGFEVRAFVPGLTPKDVVARLAIGKGEICRRIALRKAAEAKARREAGIQANDAEGRKLRGEPVTRGPRGTNHTSPRRCKTVPPIPSDLDLETSASFGGDRGDKVPGERERTPLASGSAPPAHAEGSWSGEPTPPAEAAPGAPTPSVAEPTRGTRARREEGERIVPTTVVKLAAWRATRATVNWFLSECALHGVPVNALERRQVAWCRAEQFSREDLALALRRARRAARTAPESAFRRVFGDRGVMGELIHEERRMRDDEDVPARPRTGQFAGGGAAPPVPRPASAAELAAELVRLPPPPKAPPLPLSQDEAMRRLDEQRAILDGLIRGELVEVPIVGSVK